MPASVAPQGLQADTKCSYGGVNTDGTSWPNGVSYDWWITDNSSYPDPIGFAMGTAADISQGGSVWVNRQSKCGSFAATRFATNNKGTTAAVASVNPDSTCSPLNDWSSVMTFKGITDSNTLATTCWYQNLGGGLWEADIAFNSHVNWAVMDNGFWMCEPSTNQYLLRAVAAHEIGHAAGLSHAPQESGQIMRPNTFPCDWDGVNLGTGDYNSLASLYHY